MHEASEGPEARVVRAPEIRQELRSQVVRPLHQPLTNPSDGSSAGFFVVDVPPHSIVGNSSACRGARPHALQLRSRAVFVTARHHDHCTPGSRRLAAAPKSAESGQNWTPSNDATTTCC